MDACHCGALYLDDFPGDDLCFVGNVAPAWTLEAPIAEHVPRQRTTSNGHLQKGSDAV